MDGDFKPEGWSAPADYLPTLNAITKRLRDEKAARDAAPPPGE